MKERKYERRLSLSKSTISNLNSDELNTLWGGLSIFRCDTEYTGCEPCHTIGESVAPACIKTQIKNCYSGVGMTQCVC
jgi:hypothetical protein